MKIVIACGGSGGHIFPAIALAHSLKEKDDKADILFIGSNKTLDKRLFQKENFRYSLLSANSLPHRPSFGIISFFVILLADLTRSIIILLKERPDIVAGFGGYISSPVIVAAYILRIPRVVHEQNAVPGRANSFLFKFVDKIAISFEGTKKYLGRNSSKAVFTGNPIRASLMTDDRSGSIKRLGLDQNKFTILVIGGSQGAHNLNKTFLRALALMDMETRASLQVIHITGISDYEWARAAYSETGIECRVFSFVDRIEEAYSASDLVVTRSGASAIFEIAYFGLPMVLIPYPFALSHQAENARVFSSNGAAIQLDEKGLTPETMKENITGLLKDRTRLGGMALAAKRLSVPGSSSNLARELMRLKR